MNEAGLSLANAGNIRVSSEQMSSIREIDRLMSTARDEEI